jgi:hypothetical protein
MVPVQWPTPRLQVPELIHPIVAGTPNVSPLPGQQLPDITERMMHGAQIGGLLMKGKNEAAQAAANAAISEGIVQRHKSFEQVMKAIDQGKYTDGRPFDEGYKAVLKAEAAAMSGESWSGGQGYADPAAWAKWQLQLHPEWAHNPPGGDTSSIFGGGFPDLSHVQDPNAPKTNQPNQPNKAAPPSGSGEQKKETAPPGPKETYPKGYGILNDGNTNVASNTPAVAPASFLNVAANPSNSGMLPASFLQSPNVPTNPYLMPIMTGQPNQEEPQYA